MTGPPGTSEEAAQLTAAVLVASQALVAIAARSLDDLEDDITLPQYRALVVLATRGPSSLSGLAAAVGVHRSSAHRLCNRLIDTGLIDRTASETSGREVTLALTSSGGRLVRRVLDQRRSDIARVVQAMSPDQRRHAVEGFIAFAAAAGEPSRESWAWGWPG